MPASLLPGWTLWPARWTWQRAATLIKRSSFYHRPLSAALRRFSDEWWPLAQPLLLWQGKRLFHFGSAVVALGLIAGFYLRGIALEYRAGWESTFLGPAQVRSLLGLIYGPASALTGIALPADDAAVAALHWRDGQGGGAGGAVDPPDGGDGDTATSWCRACCWRWRRRCASRVPATRLDAAGILARRMRVARSAPAMRPCRRRRRD